MKRPLFALAAMILAVTGCQNTPGGNEAGIPTDSVKGFAKEYNLSEAEAAEYFRNGQTFSRNPQQIATDPPVDSRVTKTGLTELGPTAEPFGEATASDAPSGSLEPPQSDLGSGMIRTIGGFGPKTY